MHGLVLCLEGEDVLRALRPGLAVVRVHVSHYMGHTVLVVAQSLCVCVEVAGAVVLPVEVSVAFEGVVAVERNDKLDPVALGVVHEVVQAVENGVVVFARRVAFEAGVAGELSAFLGRGLAWWSLNWVA
jgi:hypothetical protein